MAKQKLPKGIRLRGSKYLVDVTVNGQRKTATRDTLEEATEARAFLSGAMQTGKTVVQHRSNARVWTLPEALAKTLSIPPKEGWRGISYEKQATLNVEDAIAFFGPDRLLDTLDREAIDSWLDHLEAKGNSDSTVNRKLSAISKVMKLAVAYGGLSHMPHMPKQRKEPVGRIRQISLKEEQQMLAYLKVTGQGNWLGVVTILIDTGMRCGELWNVRPEDIDLKTGVLAIYGTEGKGTKNGEIRSVPMTQRVREVLLDFLGEAEGQDVFPYTNSELRHVWDRMRGYMGLAGDKDFSPHVCRHTCASRLVRAGVSLPVVQAWLGHKNIQTTMRYSHLYPQDLMNAVKALEG